MGKAKKQSHAPPKTQPTAVATEPAAKAVELSLGAPSLRLNRWTLVATALLALALAVGTPLVLRSRAVPAAPAPRTTTNALPPLTLDAIRERAAKQPCKNKEKPQVCHQSALAGHCDTSPGWMGVMCAASCARCELLDPKIRCSKEMMNISFADTYQPGGLTRVKQHILAQPDLDVDVLLEDPIMLRINHFVTDLEGQRLIETTANMLKRSTDQGAFDEAGVQAQVVSQSRTSSNAWCVGRCESDPVVRALLERIANLTLSHPNNFESFQVLRYKLGEKYDVHHDGSNDNHMPAGPRVMTFFLYLSDVEEGGETNFPTLGVKVKPRKGAALLWPSVLDADPTRVDPRTSHAAMPVIKGTKYAANVWIHLRDYVTPNKWGCTGSFDML